MGIHDELHACVGFEWDEGNRDKNWEKHAVSDVEAEQVFFNLPLLAHQDQGRSRREARFHAPGQTDAGRLLLVVFTIRSDRIRVISARDMTRREQKVYES